MKYKNLLVLLLVNLNQFSSHAAQEPLVQDEPFVIVPFEQLVESTIKNYPGINQTFTFLQEKHLVNQSFRQFLQTELTNDEDENDARGANFGEVLEQAHEIIAANMKDQFIEALENTISVNECFVGDEFEVKHSSIFWHIISHKDNYMQSMVREWVNTWMENKNISKTSLHMAIMNDCREGVICMLIDAGANVNGKDNHGKTPLHWAITNSRREVVRLLIDAGANLNSQDCLGNSPLHLAASGDHISSHQAIKRVHILINAGADLTIQNNNGETPLHRATSSCHYKVDDETPLHRATSSFRYSLDEKVVRILINANFNVNQQDNNGKTPLHRAISTRSIFYPVNEKVIRMLIDPNSNVNQQDKDGNAPLHTAISTYGSNRADKKTVQMLISASANVNLQDNYGNTPLHFAVYNNHVKVVRILINEGADLTIQSASGDTAQQVARTFEMRIIFMRARIQKALSCTIS